MRYHFTTVRTAVNKKTDKKSVGEDVESKENLCTAGGNSDTQVLTLRTGDWELSSTQDHGSTHVAVHLPLALYEEILCIKKI